MIHDLPKLRYKIDEVNVLCFFVIHTVPRFFLMKISLHVDHNRKTFVPCDGSNSNICIFEHLDTRDNFKEVKHSGKLWQG